MAGVLEQLFRPQKKVVVYRNPKELELQTAKEILAEVFRVRLSEVDEMIQNRSHAEDTDKRYSNGEGLWPQELWVG
jgi:spore maturation protein CgeB